MFDSLDKPIYEFSTRVNVENVESELDPSIVNLQYSGVDSYANLDAYLRERRAFLYNLKLDDFSDSDCLLRAWLFDRVIIHAELYPSTRTAHLTFFLLKKECLLLDVENVVLKYRTHLASKR